MVDARNGQTTRRRRRVRAIRPRSDPKSLMWLRFADVAPTIRAPEPAGHSDGSSELMVRIVRVLVAATLVLMVFAFSSSATNAATQEDCTFTPPKPGIASGKAKFTFSARCGNLTLGSRRIRVQLVGVDGPVRQKMGEWVIPANGSGTQRFSVSGVRCNEDRIGRDELRVRARVETKFSIYGWQSRSWVEGQQISANCV